MWEIIKDRLLWSLIVLLVSSWISYHISRHMLKKNLKSTLYIDELKEIKDLLRVSLEDIDKTELIFMQFSGLGYEKNKDARSRIENLSLNDSELKSLLGKYLQFVDGYNKEYFDYNKKHSEDPYKDVAGIEQRNKVLVGYKQSLLNLYQKINSRIEKIIT